MTVTDFPIGKTPENLGTIAGGASLQATPVDVVVISATTPPSPNIATVTGIDPIDGERLRDADTATLDLGDPALQIIKSVVAGPGGSCPAAFDASLDGPLPALTTEVGATITYCFWVRNIGTGSADNVTVTDAGVGKSPENLGLLLAGDTIQATSVDTVVVSDTDPPNPNTATVTGTDPAGGPSLFDTDDATIALGAPVLEIVKSVVAGPGGSCPTAFDASFDGPLPALATEVGATVTYCFWVRNIGDGPADSVTVVDPGVGKVAENLGRLAAGAAISASPVDAVIVDATTPPNPNNATVTGIDPSGGTDPTDSDTATLILGSPDLQIIKSVSAGPAGACPSGFDATLDGPNPPLATDIGDTVTYCFWVLNAGDGPAFDVRVTDTGIAYDSGNLGRLDAGQSVQAAAVDVVVVDLATPPSPNRAFVRGIDPVDGADVIDSDTATIDRGEPLLQLIKSVVAGPNGTCPAAFDAALDGPGPPLATQVGDTVTYCFWIENTGSVAADDVEVVDVGISYTSGNLGTVAPGTQRQAPPADVVVESSTTPPNPNTATVTGINAEGGPDPFDDDDASLLLGAPVLELAKSVVAGPNGSCPSGFDEALVGDADALSTEVGATVTYCFWVRNVGDGPADDVTVSDAAIGYDPQNLGPLPAGQAAQAPSADVVIVSATTPPNPNTATVTGTDPGGSTSPSDADTALFDLGAPVLELVKSVVAGPNGTCPATFDESLDGPLPPLPAQVGDTVTYCFWVRNTGTGPADDVSVVDTGIGYGPQNLGRVVAGASVQAASVDVIIESDTTPPNPNTAAVSGTDPAGGPVVGDTDTATIDLGSPVLELAKSVVAGPNGSCPIGFDEALVGDGDALSTQVGDTVTYCFWVRNTGNGRADDVTVADDGIGYAPQILGTLQPGASLQAPSADVLVESATQPPNPNTATVTGVDPGGSTSLSDDDTAILALGAPVLELVKSVVAGPNGTCPAAFDESLDGPLPPVPVQLGDTVTYCFWVRNAGNGPADDVTVADAAIGYDSANLGTLAAGASVMAAPIDVPVELTTPNPNVAVVTGTDPSGGPDPTDDDTATLRFGGPILEIVKTAVAGPAGACPDADVATAGSGAPLVVTDGDTVTWCIAVRNVGSTAADTVVIGDDQAPQGGFEVSQIGPGDEAVVSYDVVVDDSTDATNVASVNGNGPDGPIYTDGNEPQGQAQITVARLDLAKTVVGTDRSCDDAVEGVNDFHVGAPGDAIRWCFTVTNTGTTHLTDLTFTDAPAAVTNLDVFANFDPTRSSLAPGGAVAFELSGAIGDEPLDNIASVTAVPADSLGAPLPNGSIVEDIDDARVDHASINLAKTVVAGSNGDCASATEKAVVPLGGPVTFCFTVTNTGNVDVVIDEIVDETLSETVAVPNAPLVLEPDAAATVRLVHTASSALVNTASVIGTPLGPDGAAVAGVLVGAEDTARAEVLSSDLAIVKSTDATSAVPGARISYSLEVVNDGPDPAPGVRIIDELPAGMTIDGSVAADGWDCAASTAQVIDCVRAGDLAVSETDALRYTIRFDSSLTEQSYTNIAEVSGEHPDPDEDDNIDTTTITRRAPAPTTPPVTAAAAALPDPSPYTNAPPAPASPVPSPVASSPLAFTGAHSLLMSMFALAALLFGGGFVIASRRLDDD